MNGESILYLLKRGVRVAGIDAWSWDRLLPFMADEFRKSGDKPVTWEAHFAVMEKGDCHMEKLNNLDKITQSCGLKIACLPIKIKGASAGWTRPVAIINE